MTSSIQIIDATFTKSVSRIPPYASLATLLSFFGGTEADSKVNYLGDKAPLTLIGAPTYGDGFANVGGSVGFETGIVSASNSWTHCVVTTAGAGNGIYMGNWTPGDTDAAIGRFNTSVYPYLANSTRGTGTPYSSGSGFNFLAASHNGTTAKVHAASAGVVTTVSAAYTGVTVTAALRIGGAIGSGTTTNSVAAAMSFNTVLSDAQVLEVHDYLKYMLARRGIAIA